MRGRQGFRSRGNPTIVDRLVDPVASPEQGQFNRDDEGLAPTNLVRVDANISKERQLSHTHGCRSEEHTSELQSLMRISYAVFCLNKQNTLYTFYHSRHISHLS